MTAEPLGPAAALDAWRGDAAECEVCGGSGRVPLPPTDRRAWLDWIASETEPPEATEPCPYCSTRRTDG